ncbi:MAG TPA: BON domain-containing protein [Acidisarcina sp.]|nr:BON domain-containing protein [Acidisarcina sp.]
MRSAISVLGIGLLGLGLAIGCKSPQHPPVKDNVVASLKANNLGDLSVDEDRDKGVVTLKGDVQTEDLKTQAETLARNAAPGYVVANEVGVRPTGMESQAKSVDSNLDDAIESNYKAMLKGNKALDAQSIHYKAKNGTLVLTGSVKTAAERTDAANLAKTVPNVQQVVNEIEIKK